MNTSYENFFSSILRLDSIWRGLGLISPKKSYIILKLFSALKKPVNGKSSCRKIVISFFSLKLVNLQNPFREQRSVSFEIILKIQCGRFFQCQSSLSKFKSQIKFLKLVWLYEGKNTFLLFILTELLIKAQPVLGVKLKETLRYEQLIKFMNF